MMMTEQTLSLEASPAATPGPGRDPRRLPAGVTRDARRLIRRVTRDPRQLIRRVTRDARQLIRGVRRDARHWQILALAGLLSYGVIGLDLEVRPLHALAILATVLGTQFAASRVLGPAGPRAWEPRSALISGLSLCLLLRTGSVALAAATAAVTILSKFLIRRRGKHMFNPTNFGIVVMMLATGRVWVSPGQWGSAAFFTFLLLCAGGLVVNRAARGDVTYAFLGFYLAIVFGRSLWLGQPLAIPLHQLESGALLIFTFFMISDPKSTPDSRAGRIVFALLVAALAGVIQFVLYRPNGLLLALAACALLTPLIDVLLPGRRYQWVAPAAAVGTGSLAHADTPRPALSPVAGAPAIAGTPRKSPALPAGRKSVGTGSLAHAGTPLKSVPSERRFV